MLRWGFVWPIRCFLVVSYHYSAICIIDIIELLSIQGGYDGSQLRVWFWHWITNGMYAISHICRFVCFSGLNNAFRLDKERQQRFCFTRLGKFYLFCLKIRLLGISVCGAGSEYCQITDGHQVGTLGFDKG